MTSVVFVMLICVVTLQLRKFMIATETKLLDTDQLGQMLKNIHQVDHETYASSRHGTNERMSPWLEYSVSSDAAFCFICRRFGSLGMLFPRFITFN